MSEMFPEDSDRYTDPIDQACQVETRMRENDVAAARLRAAPEQVQLPVLDEAGKPCHAESGEPLMYWPITECEDCGDDIPPPRLALGKVRCIACQTNKEKRSKQYGA